jgi:hypothetical protein
MLGMRHISGHIAVDLWCGDVADFACDTVFQWASSSAEGELEIEKLELPPAHLSCQKTILISISSSEATAAVLIKAMVQALEFEALQKPQHITLTPLPDEFRGSADEVQAKTFMEAIKLYLSANNEQRLLRRVTFALPDLKQYKVFEQALFAAFPEED